MRSLVLRLRSFFPGLVLSAGIGLQAMGLARLAEMEFGRAWLEPLVLAILVGAVVRTWLPPPPACRPGISLSAGPALELAIVLLGASISTTALRLAGPALVLEVAGVVVLAILASYGIGRALGLAHRPAMLVACGNSICGNSAIAAAAPVLGASGEEVAAPIALTAVLGMVVVIGLPLLAPILHLSAGQFGILAGLTVYAVPQVVVATAPVSALSVQVGTLVKLLRVLMLGPVVLALALGTGRDARVPLRRMVPWFVVGFVAAAALRALGWIPLALLAPLSDLAGLLTILAMAGLGLSVDLRAMAGTSGRVAAAVLLSLLALAGISYLLLLTAGVA
jgi:uncharacterized integral membrane protein (TIGR00698 family)